MSAVNPIETPSSSQQASVVPERSHEPSMEEILASIRRIIADDQSLPNHALSRESEPFSRMDRVQEVKPRDVVSSPPMVQGSPATAVPPSAGPERPAPAVEPFEERRHAPDAPPEMATPTPFEVRQAQGEAAASRIEAPAPGYATLSGHMAHGSVDAPQFAMPDAPVDFPRHQAVHRPQAPHAAPGLDMALERETSSPEAEVAPEPTYVRTAPRAATVEAYQEEEEVGYDEPLRHAEAGDRSPGDVALASDALFSAATDASVTSAFKTLAATRLADNSDELLEIARDMIRPLLKTWIDNNLPSMVERLVRAEIERVSRGGR